MMSDVGPNGSLQTHIQGVSLARPAYSSLSELWSLRLNSAALVCNVYKPVAFHDQNRTPHLKVHPPSILTPELKMRTDPLTGSQHRVWLHTPSCRRSTVQGFISALTAMYQKGRVAQWKLGSLKSWFSSADYEVVDYLENRSVRRGYGHSISQVHYGEAIQDNHQATRRRAMKTCAKSTAVPNLLPLRLFEVQRDS